ncbi:MAG TPA: hypothetical protein VGE50_01690 [Gammaproteobacteria bacterium]
MKMGSLLGGVMLLGVCLSVPVAQATDDELKLELKSGATFKQLLSDQVGKRVVIRVASGEDLQGTVVSVGDKLVHIAKVEGRDFYDAVINLDSISAVQIMVRGPYVARQR